MHLWYILIKMCKFKWKYIGVCVCESRMYVNRNSSNITLR